jgi:hypothetical protein
MYVVLDAMFRGEGRGARSRDFSSSTRA